MRAVFFDAGGTLVHIDHARVAGCVARTLGRQLAVDAFVAAEYAARAAVEAALGRGTTDAERGRIHFAAMLADLGVLADDFARVGPEILAEHQRKHLWCVVPPGLGEALDSLVAAGWYAGVISNADGKVEQLLERLGLRHRFQFVIDSGAVGVEKPDPRIFAMAVERAGIPAAQTYYVGDVHAIDVVGSKNAGLVPVLLDPLSRYGHLGCRTTPDVPSFCRELVSLRDAA